MARGSRWRMRSRRRPSRFLSDEVEYLELAADERGRQELRALTCSEVTLVSHTLRASSTRICGLGRSWSWFRGRNVEVMAEDGRRSGAVDATTTREPAQRATRSRDGPARQFRIKQKAKEKRTSSGRHTPRGVLAMPLLLDVHLPDRANHVKGQRRQLLSPLASRWPSPASSVTMRSLPCLKPANPARTPTPKRRGVKGNSFMPEVK